MRLCIEKKLEGMKAEKTSLEISREKPLQQVLLQHFSTDDNIN